MTRTDFPAAVADALAAVLPAAPSPRQVAPLAFAMWDAAQQGADSEEAFRAALVAGVASLARETAALTAA